VHTQKEKEKYMRREKGGDDGGEEKGKNGTVKKLGGGEKVKGARTQVLDNLIKEEKSQRKKKMKNEIQGEEKQKRCLTEKKNERKVSKRKEAAGAKFVEKKGNSKGEDGCRNSRKGGASAEGIKWTRTKWGFGRERSAVVETSKSEDREKL